MGVPGVPWVPPTDIVACLKKHRGVMSRACEELDCAYSTLQKYVHDRPELVELVRELRIGFIEKGLDVAENVVLKKMDSDESQDQLKAAIYFLNNQGKKRGYAHPDVASAAELRASDIIKEAVAGKLSQLKERDASKSD